MAGGQTLEQKTFYPQYSGPHETGSLPGFKGSSKRFGWRDDRVSMIDEIVDGVPVIMAEFGGKPFVNVVKSIGTFTNRISPSFLSTPGVVETWHGQPRISRDYPVPSTEYIQALYAGAGARPQTLVFGPGVETCAYLGAVLGAPVLPTQFVATANNLEEVERNANPCHNYIVGHDMDWQNLKVVIKPQHLGDLYAEMISRAKEVLIFSANSGDNCELGTQRGWVKDNIHVIDINSSTPESYGRKVRDAESRGYQAVHDRFPDVETAMHPDQITNLEDYCLDQNFRTVMISSGEWRGMIPSLLYKALFEKNELHAAGITFNSGLSYHPFYEREFLRIPVNDFMYGTDEYVKQFDALMKDINWGEDQPTAEFMTWSTEFDRSSMRPDDLFKGWGFVIEYKNTRPYDIWRFGWKDTPDPECPTRDYILPKIRSRKSFRAFDFLSFDEMIEAIRDVEKTNFMFYG